MKMYLAANIAAAAISTFALCAHAVERPWEVHDANGKRMGRFFGAPNLGGGVQLVVNSKKYLVPIVGASDSRGLVARWLYFLTDDCTGPPYAAITNLYGQRFGVTTISPSGQVLFYPAGTTSQLATVPSARNSDGACVGAGGSIYVAPLDAPIDITTVYPRPFTIK